MMFSRIVCAALGVGVLTGLLLSLMQVLTVDPIIFASEAYEVAGSASQPASAESHDHGDGHAHSHEGWGPEDGAERTFYTVLSNVFAAIGFAAVVLALMSQFWLPKRRDIRPLQGLAWGLAGFLAVYFAPGIGLQPEIPGIEAPPLENRQAWWLLTVACVGVGIGFLAFAPGKLKAAGLALIAVPYIVGAPAHEGPAFTHPDPQAVAALTDLHGRFILASGTVNLVFWIVLGLVCALAFNRWLRTMGESREQPA